MGHVYRATHGRSRTPVAIKVLASERAIDPAFCTAFRDEVRAIAALDHPAIVMVFDQGQVTLGAARASKGALAVGAPFLVMELLPHGTLVDLARDPRSGSHRTPSFSTLRAVLLDALDGLAHAHARGVVHRDIKPGNIMLTGATDASAPRVKLTDFGIAFHTDGDEAPLHAGETNAFSGTPHYMAPEQAEGRLREIGPWTDLYALGCVAFRLLTGRAPYQHTGADVSATLRAQIAAPIPELEESIEVPDALSRWIHTAMAKRWQDRFRCAADAAAALREIAEGPRRSISTHTFKIAHESQDQPAREPSTDDQATRVATRSATRARPAEAMVPWSEPASQHQPTQLFVPSASDRPAPRVERSTRIASLPLDPTPRRRAQREAALVDAGLGLFAVRAAPMVDRELERTALWRALFDVHTDRRPRAIALSGPIGVGKTRILQWLSTRARELGGATVLTAQHAAQPTPQSGVGPMIARALRTSDLGRAAAFAHTADAVQAIGGRVSDAIALVERTHPAAENTGDHDGPAVRFASDRERDHAALRYIELLCRERPVILRIDDAQWASDALTLAQRVFDSATPLPVLCVLDFEPDALSERSRAAIDGLLASTAAAHLRVEPLHTEHQEQLVRSLLSLRPALVKTVVERSGGHPLFAVQIVTDWVQRRLVRATDDGFELSSSDGALVSDELHEFLLDRVARTVDRDASALAAIERAAVLGRTFDPAEWRACAGIDASRMDEVGAALQLAGLLTRGVDRLSFAHALVVEALVRAARDRGALAEHHLACAAMLEQAPAARGKRARIARHLALGGRVEAALAPMLAAAQESFETSDFAGVTAIVTEREQWMDAMDLPESDPRRAQGWMRLAHAEARLARPRDAAQWLDRVERYVQRHPEPLIEADLLHGRARAAQMSGDMAIAATLYEQAIARFEALAQRRAIAQCEHGLAEVLKQCGRVNECEPHYLRAFDEYAASGDRVGAANCRLGYGDYLTRTDRARATAALDQAVVELEAIGARLGVAIAQQIRGISARYDGRYDAAHEAFLRAAEMLEAVGSMDAPIARTNAGIIDLLRGQFVRATRFFEDAHRVFTALGREGYLCFATVELLACRAHFGQWEAFDALIEQAERLVPRSALIDEDLELCLRIAHEEATRAGQSERALRIEPLWRAQREGMAPS